MGCDIHLFSEIKDGGKWHCIDGFIDQRGYIETISFLDDSRNYRLFAILAGVRSSSGVTPIVLPRGLPNDCSKEAMRASTEFAGDGHSHSWLSLDELETYDWNEVGIAWGTTEVKRLRERAIERPVRIVFFFDN